jgi:hypothetical protein
MILSVLFSQQSAMNTMDFAPGSSASFQTAGRSCPSHPTSQQSTTGETKKADPSAATRRENYPIPGFFDYRLRAASYEVL